MALPQVGLKGPIPGLVADLLSIINDLQFAGRCAESYAAKVGDRDGDGDTFVGDDVELKALWNAGVIAYRRAFKSGRGHLVDKGSRLRVDSYFLRILDADQKQAHELIMELANKHVAHRVGDEEGVVVSAFLQPPPGERDYRYRVPLHPHAWA